MKNSGYNIKHFIVPISSFFLSIFFPKRCVNCGTLTEQFVCHNCVKNIENIKTSTCPACGKISQFSKFCPNCKTKEKTDLAGIITAARYEKGPIKEMVHYLKYSGIIELSDLLGELLVERLKREMPKGNLIVVPVPLHRKREFSRGFNQAELIARYVSKRLEIPGGIALKRVKNTQSQVTLSGDARRTNLQNAFVCEDGDLIIGKTVLLVDDVTTTGSTLNECAKILKENGAKQVFGVVVAKRMN